LYGLGRLGAYARIMALQSLVSLPLSVALAYAWGTVGVIWGTVIPSAVGLPVSVAIALRELAIPATAFCRAVVPAFGAVGAWAAAVVVAKTEIAPSGFLGLAAFSAIALPPCWALLAPMTVARLRRARPQPATRAPET
jgi:hypothetical protein